jgi:hypothetical protein
MQAMMWMWANMEQIQQPQVPSAMV